MFARFLLCFTSALALAASANAADISLNESGSLKDSPVDGPMWTGFFLGAHGGYVWVEPDFPGAPAYPEGPPRPELEGGFVGGQIGYNLQFDRIVLGVVGDISFANLEETVRDGNYLTETTAIDRFGTARAVAGISLGRWLPYGTIGLAWANVSYDLNCPEQAAAPFGICSRSGPRHSGDDQTLTGLAYGGGLKYAIDNHFSVGAEYLHLDFGEEEFSFGAIGGAPAGTGKIDASSDLVKFSVDYKFGDGGY